MTHQRSRKLHIERVGNPILTVKKLLTLLAIAVFITSCGDSPTTANNEKETPIHEKLAVIDDIYDQNDIKAIRIKTLVNDLSLKYAEPADSIGEYTYRVKAVLRDKGIDESILSILEQMNKTQKMENTPYKDAATLYLLVRAN